MTHEEALEKYQDEFDDWIYRNYPIGNGDMLIAVYEDGHSFDTFIRDFHPEIGELE